MKCPPRGRGQRWTGAERARYLREFAESGLSAAAFVRQTGVPQSTFDLWRQEARLSRGRAARQVAATLPAGFARVEVLPATGATGLTLVVRSRGVTAEFAGLDAATAVALLEPVLRSRLR